jgi:hypothetical protein
MADGIRVDILHSYYSHILLGDAGSWERMTPE